MAEVLSVSGREREGRRERGKVFSGWREGGESGEGRGGKRGIERVTECLMSM